MSDVCGVCGQPGWKGHPLTEGYHVSRNECVYALTKALQAEQGRVRVLTKALRAWADKGPFIDREFNMCMCCDLPNPEWTDPPPHAIGCTWTGTQYVLAQADAESAGQ